MHEGPEDRSEGDPGADSHKTLLGKCLRSSSLALEAATSEAESLVRRWMRGRGGWRGSDTPVRAQPALGQMAFEGTDVPTQFDQSCPLAEGRCGEIIFLSPGEHSHAG